jgi:molecular chaperone GrpE
VVDSFTALRHEIKLQTKGLRGLQDHLRTNQEAVEGAVDELQSNRRDTVKNAEEAALAAARPLIMGLLDIDEAIVAAVKSTEMAVKGRDHSKGGKQSLIDELEQEFQQLPSWKRIWLKNYWQQVRHRLEEFPEPARQFGQTETLEGLRLLQRRVRRVLTEAEVEPTKCLGHRVEPRTMRVIEVIEAPGQPPETVVDEIRAGYQWKGITLRPAEVRATKSKVTETRNDREKGAEFHGGDSRNRLGNDQ